MTRTICMMLSACLVLVGCDTTEADRQRPQEAKDSSARDRTETKAKTEAAKKEVEAVEAPASKEDKPDPLVKAAPADETAEKKGGYTDPKGHPFDRWFKLQHAMYKALGDNLETCEKSIGALTDFVKKNRAEFLDLHKRGDKMLASITPAEKAALDSRVSKQMNELRSVSFKILGKFHKQCPKQTRELEKQVDTITKK